MMNYDQHIADLERELTHYGKMMDCQEAEPCPNEPEYTACNAHLSYRLSALAAQYAEMRAVLNSHPGRWAGDEATWAWDAKRKDVLALPEPEVAARYRKLERVAEAATHVLHKWMANPRSVGDMDFADLYEFTRDLERQDGDEET